MPVNNPDFAKHLIAWQQCHGRHDLPWQQTRDAYRIWLSEIMLQQTQVATVVPYYQRFLQRFPDVALLAAAQVGEVMALWAGLGYYARARNLHRCAQVVVAEHGGHFPSDVEALATLPGIGRSTAAAIAVFAFGRRAAILDGNVKRVLARCFGIGGFPGKPVVERELWALAESLLPARDVEAYIQGQMDLGATLCTRGKPRCGDCPMRGICVAEREGRQAALPEGRPAKALPERESVVSVFTDGTHVLLERRPPIGIWGGLLALPEGAPEDLAPRFGLVVTARAVLPDLPHSFTHFRLVLRPIVCHVDMPRRVAESGCDWIQLTSIGEAALPAPIRKLLESLSAKPP